MARILAILLLPLALAACVVQPSRGDRPGFVASAGTGEVTRQVADLRGARGLAPLRRDVRLDRAAAAHAAELRARGVLSHRGQGGSTVMQRSQAAGYPACVVAENLAWGQADLGAALASWMGSPGHRRNLLWERVTAFGFAQDGPVRAMVFGAPCPR